jgi:CRISPR-associated protein Cas2
MSRRTKGADTPTANRILSGYRLMWLLVMFDLPVGTPAERKASTDFRKALLDLGFERCQFSVYLRFLTSYEQATTYLRRVDAVLPEGGKVYCLTITDKQYEGIVRYERRMKLPPAENPSQFVLI